MICLCKNILIFYHYIAFYYFIMSLLSQFLLLSTLSVLMIRSGRNQKMSLTTVECFDPHRVSFYLNQSKALRRWPWASDLKYLKSLHKVSVSTTRQSTFLHFKTFYRQEGLSLYEVFYLVLSKSDKMFRMSGEIWSLICHLYLSEASVIPSGQE